MRSRFESLAHTGMKTRKQRLNRQCFSFSAVSVRRKARVAIRSPKVSSQRQRYFVTAMKISALNYTQVPNVILDHMNEFSDAEFRLIMFICRQTFGFHRNHKTMSLTYFQQGTGMSRQGVINAVNGLLEKQLIFKESDGQSFIYGLVIEGETDQSTGLTEPVNEFDRLPVNVVDTNKERTRNKDIKETKGVFKKPELQEMKLHAAKIRLPESEAIKCFNYYESNGWRVGRNPMKSWQAAMVNWRGNWQERNPALARRIQQPATVRSGEEEF